MKIIFVTHNGLASNSGIHVANLASGIGKLGADVVVAVPDGDPTTHVPGTPYAVISYGSALSHVFRDGGGASLVHAWTPRQHVAQLTRQISTAHGCPYVVHLEDNEHAITAAYLGLSIEELRARDAADPHMPVPHNLSQPADMRDFLNGSAGVSALIDRLLEFKPAHVPGVEIWPAAENDLFYPQPKDPALRAELGIGDQTIVLVYHGNVHPANVAEVRSLYLAVGALARSGVDIALVRLGTDHAPVLPPDLRCEMERLIISVPFQPRERIAPYLALADVLVQPGRADDFNSYRFPSKLPEFFAMGRPVILPATNVGLTVAADEEAVLLQRGDALELAEKIMKVISDRQLSAKLSAGGRSFYERKLDWEKSAVSLMQFYNQLDVKPRLDDLRNDLVLNGIAKHYADYRVPDMLGYATVRDYSESIEVLPALATLNRDLKDAQRPWVLKAILGGVSKGGRLLEIGAGDPWVADLLVRMGYEVVIVDPYDGRDRGPAEYEMIKKQFPNIKFLRGLFPDALSELGDAKFDCIYSISVLEHLPTEAVKPVFDGILAHSRNRDTRTIHAIDHVLLGDGAESHLALLAKMVECLGFDAKELDDVLQKLRDDPDTYFLSANAHNRWRGKVPYDDFPMRRCVSMQICAPAGGRSRSDQFCDRIVISEDT